MPHYLEQLKWLLPQFIEGEELAQVRTLQGGIINATYLVTSQSGQDLILQRLNPEVFKQPQSVMENITYVTEHLQRVTPNGRNLALQHTVNGSPYLEHEEYGLWRAFHYLSGCVSHTSVTSCTLAYEAGRAYGSFLKQLEALDATLIQETIPHFHHTPKRYEALLHSAHVDHMKRAQSVTKELTFISDRSSWLSQIEDLRTTGGLPERITHNDTKISNVLFDAQTDHAVCVIDFDTIMPGTMLYDFGDLVRTSVNSTKEDQPADAVECRLDLFKALSEGYITAAGSTLTETEISLMVFSAKLITLELAMRFLKDYLDGDLYFTIEREHQNLDRARNQLALVERLEENSSQMEDIITQIRHEKHVL